MKKYLNELEILPENPFNNCKLNREKNANVLTSIVKNFSTGFVLAINNKWGTGKTTFIKMWNQKLKNEEFRTLYFNAWENDIDTEPMVAILGELKSLVGDSENKLLKSVLTNGAVLAKNIVPSLAKALANKYIDLKIVGEAIEGTLKGTTEILTKEVENYSKKKKSITDFKIDLHKYIVEQSSSKPLVFFIDELDRCRPDYAVEVLEKIKHFFSVDGIVFVLSIDREQLENSIKGYYGNDKINANDYLRRFIDVEYRLPEPKYEEFCKYLYDKFNFKDFIESSDRNGLSLFKYDSTEFVKFATLLFNSKNLTIRQQEKIFSHAKIALITFKFNSYLFPSIFLLLIYIREFEPKYYIDIKNQKYSIQELVEILEKLVAIDIVKSNPDVASVYYIISQFIVMYNLKDYDFIQIENLILVNGEERLLSFKSIIDSFKPGLLLSNIEHILREREVRPLKVLISKIDLLDYVS